MSAVQVPAELIERAAGALESIHVQTQAANTWSVFTVIANELRALLPRPEPTCPNCWHWEHGPDGCLGEDCDCAFSPAAIRQVRALFAVEKDTTRAGTCRCGHSREAHYGEAGYPETVAGWHCGVALGGLPGQCTCVGYLLATEKDTPTQPQPRVWNAGDPEPAGVNQVWDKAGDRWTRRAYGWRRDLPGGHIWAPDWEYLTDEWAPLTDQPPAGAR